MQGMLLRVRGLEGVALPKSHVVERTLYLVHKIDPDVTKEAV